MVRGSSKKITAITLCLLLAACGGGSDSPGNASNAGTGSDNSGATGSSNTNGSSGTSGNTPTATGSSDTGSSSGNTGSTGGSGGSTGDANGATGAITGSTAGASTFTYDETARFNTPEDIKADSAGNLYVLDAGNKAIRKVAADGSVSTLPVALMSPRAMEIDAAGNFYVVDAGILYKVTPAGSRSALTSVGSVLFPGCLTIDRQGNLYVLFSQDGVPVIRRIDTNGAVTTQTLEQGAAYRSIAADDAGNLYVGRYTGTGIGSIRKIAPDGMQSDFVTGNFDDIGNMAFDRQGNLFIAQFRELLPAPGCGEFDSCYVGGTDQLIRKIAADGTITTVLSGPPGGSLGDVAYDTSFGRYYLAVGPDGNLYAAYKRKQAVYKVTQTAGTILIAGKPGEAGTSD